jgi:hypothetical protein
MTDINSTKAGVSQNSYASTDDADDYLEGIYDSGDWFELTDTQKESLLMMATKSIDRLRVIFPSTTTTQALKFPVSTYSRTDQEGRTLGDGYAQAQGAAILQAFYRMKWDDEIREAEGNRIQGITATTIPMLDRSFNGFNPMATMAPEAFQVLSPYIDLTVRAVR